MDRRRKGMESEKEEKESRGTTGEHKGTMNHPLVEPSTTM